VKHEGGGLAFAAERSALHTLTVVHRRSSSLPGQGRTEPVLPGVVEAHEVIAPARICS
jgi:hypothetical protein